MKYPQLVSTRAVNAISDWLVSRLEQLGVEAPPIYSRLLLSLLHSSVQINDPIEFNNLETYLANRKGSKRVPPCDTDTLKKFTAVQCLVDAVSSEQEISKIENLVDELCEKLSDIEKQSNEEDLHQIPTTLKTLDIEDPRKRYYRAFPALSKEMEDSVWMSKRNTKSLTWPTGNSGTSSSNVGALSNTAGVKRKPKRRRNQVMSKGKLASAHKSSFGDNNSPTWDTDFEGSWEMGHDLIKEFITKQNNRNRSISESDACNLRNEVKLEKRMKQNNKEEVEDDEQKIIKQHQQEYCEEIDNYIPPSLSSSSNMDCKDDNIVPSTKSKLIKKSYSTANAHKMLLPNDDGYATYDDLTLPQEVDGTSNMMARRLYERDVTNNNHNINLIDSPTNLSSEQNDFAQFEAKFNSSVEALWKDSSNEITSSKLPNHQNLENFWTNYYNHHYNADRFGNNNNNTMKNDFFSMPANFGKTDAIDPVTAVNSNIKGGNSAQAGNKISGENFPSSGGVFMRDSIWSDNPQKNYEEDDSFYANVLGSTYKNDGKNDLTAYDVKDQPYPFISKWSECSFETPFVPSSNSSSNEASSTGYRQPVAPTNNTANSSGTSNINKNISPQSPPITLPDFYGSLRLTEKSFSKSTTAPILPPVTTDCPSDDMANSLESNQEE